MTSGVRFPRMNLPPPPPLPPFLFLCRPCPLTAVHSWLHSEGLLPPICLHTEAAAVLLRQQISYPPLVEVTYNDSNAFIVAMPKLSVYVVTTATDRLGGKPAVVVREVRVDSTYK